MLLIHYYYQYWLLSIHWVIYKVFQSPIYNLLFNSGKYEFSQQKSEVEIDTLTNVTGKSFSEVLILASTNPQYDKRLSIELPVQ